MPEKTYKLLGIPWDMGASLGRPGARYAPKKVRESLNWFFQRVKADKIYDVEKNQLVDLSGLKFEDLGDVELFYHDIKKTHRSIKEAAEKIITHNDTLIAIGGDHSVSYPLIEALHDNISGNLGLIQFDAHLDLLDENDRQGRYSQSSEIYRALELERLAPENLVQIGVRGFNYPEAYKLVNNNNITQFTPQDVQSKGPLEIARQALETAGKGTESIFLTFDIDAFDPAYAPGTGADEHNGLNPTQCFKILEVLAPEVAALDLVEVNPTFDIHGITSSLGAKVLFNFMIYNYLEG